MWKTLKQLENSNKQTISNKLLEEIYRMRGGSLHSVIRNIVQYVDGTNNIIYTNNT